MLIFFVDTHGRPGVLWAEKNVRNFFFNIFVFVTFFNWQRRVFQLVINKTNSFILKPRRF